METIRTTEKHTNLTISMLLLSEAARWPEAKLEWTIDDIYESDPSIICLCGQHISNVCILLNHKNNKQAIVGSCCAKKFIGVPSDKIFQSIKRIREDKTRSLNGESIRFGLNKGWISEWEYNFYMNTMAMRKLSGKQASNRESINKKILINIKRVSLNKSFESSTKK